MQDRLPLKKYFPTPTFSKSLEIISVTCSTNQFPRTRVLWNIYCYKKAPRHYLLSTTLRKIILSYCLLFLPEILALFSSVSTRLLELSFALPDTYHISSPLWISFTGSNFPFQTSCLYSSCPYNISHHSSACFASRPLCCLDSWGKKHISVLFFRKYTNILFRILPCQSLGIRTTQEYVKITRYWKQR